jgi:hypothetical protein
VKSIDQNDELSCYLDDASHVSERTPSYEEFIHNGVSIEEKVVVMSFQRYLEINLKSIPILSLTIE